MTADLADLADLRELTRPLSALAAFQHNHFYHLHGLQFLNRKDNTWVGHRIGPGLRDIRL
jgi:hypothetical protein